MGGVYKEILVTRAAQQRMECTAQEPNADIRLSTETRIALPHLRWLLWVFVTVLSLLNKSIKGKHSSKDSKFNWKAIAFFPATTQHQVMLILRVYDQNRHDQPKGTVTPFQQSLHENTLSLPPERCLPCVRQGGRAPGEAHSPQG